MTSSGVKRPLDFDMAQAKEESASSQAVISVTQKDLHQPNTTSSVSEPVSNGPASDDGTCEAANNKVKRRCTSNYNLSQNHKHHYVPQVSSSPFRDPACILNPMGEDIVAMIKDELHGSHDDHQCNGEKVNEPPILTAHQTQSICERLIQERERKLREEYDRVLACKLAEQYDIFAKANYFNSYVDSARLPAVAAAAAAAALPTASPVAQNPSMNALAAAFTTMQRSALGTNHHSPTTVSTVMNPTAPAMSNLTSLAASLSANNHPSAMTTSHLAAFSLQQQAAAATLQAQVQQQQQQHHHQQQSQQQQQVQSQHQQRTLTVNNGAPIPSGPVLLTSNLDEQLAVPEALFTLFGVFGDVIRVKILFNKKDNALIQMADANQAQMAQSNLDKQKIFGKVIRVTRSKHQIVQMPRDGNQSDAGLTKDFTNSALHRFKIPGSRNYLNIYPPSNTLHISNIPAATDESDLQKAFKEQCNFEFSSFKFFPKDRKMALMRFNSIEQATIALIKMHNYQISDENNLRVSFSKSLM